MKLLKWPFYIVIGVILLVTAPIWIEAIFLLIGLFIALLVGVFLLSAVFIFTACITLQVCIRAGFCPVECRNILNRIQEKLGKEKENDF